MGGLDDGLTIDGYYVLTKNYKLPIILRAMFVRMEEWSSG